MRASATKRSAVQEAPTAPTDTTVPEQCVALIDYISDLPDEISFRKGDVINVIAKNCATGYWLGRIGDREGLFPNCFCSSNMTPSRAPKFCNKAMAMYDYSPRDTLEMPLRKGDVIAVMRPSSSPGWWCGVNESAAARLKAEHPDTPPDMLEAQCGSAQAPLLLPLNFVTARIVLAEYNFHGRAAHELSFQKGDVIYVHRKWNDGWWEGTLKGKRGIFPSNFTIPNVPTTTPPFFCLRCKTVMQLGASECKECAKAEEMTTTMLRAVEDYRSGLLEKLDLCAYIEVDPAKGGRGALLSVADASEKRTRGRAQD